MPVVKTCPVCGASFSVPPSQAHRVKSCSRACGTIARPKPVAERFWPKVDKSGGPDACWPWMGHRSRGYGRVSIGTIKNRGAYLYAHRVAYELEHGSLPADTDVLHHCDNPPCCNPAHLFTGTQQANNADRDAKGRVASGEQSGRRRQPERYPKGEGWSFARLTDAEVEAIRAATGTSQHALARQYGVNQSTISRIVHGKRRAEG